LSVFEPAPSLSNTSRSNGRFEAILFDLGSTLIYFDGNWTETLPESNAKLLRSLQASGIELGTIFVDRFRAQLQAYYADRDTDFIEYTTTYVLRDVLAGFGYDSVPDPVIRDALAAMFAVTQRYWKSEADTHSTLEILRQRGYRLGLISNAGDDADVQTLLDRSDLRRYFDVILTSAGEGIRKPNPKIFWKALDSLGTLPANAAMIGDKLGADILGAKNTGIYSIWITRRADMPDNRAHIKTIQPDATIASLGELPPLLSRLDLPNHS